MEGGVLIIWKL